MKNQKASILIVDDDETNLAVLSRRLAKLGHTITTATDGQSALDIIEQDGIDVVLLDIVMPGMGGEEVLKKIRENHPLAALPVIMVTAKQETEVTVDVFRMGANDYVTKPFDPAVLNARVQTQVFQKRSEDALREAQRTLEERVRERTEDLQKLNEALQKEINERKQIQQQLIQASKLATLGEMATAVAHELNQPLSVIRMASEGALEMIADGDLDVDYLTDKLEKISAQTGRAGATIDHMRIFGRTDATESERFNPIDAVTGALDLMSEVLRLRDIEVVRDLPNDCPSILGFPMQLEQVFINLLGNARDAIGERTQAEGDGEPPPKRIAVAAGSSADGQHIEISFEDSGGGIAEEHINRVFEPFYTTKEVGKGTGLGLSISYGIVIDMGGTLDVENGGDGARFTIMLPVALTEADNDTVGDDLEVTQNAIAS